MNSKSIWNDQIPEKDGVKTPVNDIAISPDGSRVIAAVGNRVLLYKAENGDLIESLRGHKDTVYSVSFSCDGSRFSSGGADNVVVIWKASGQGLLKYNHSAPIQRVAYNPTMMILASCSDVDFGLWTPDQKQVTKEKVPSRITAACWSGDGSMLAIGMLSGQISVRNQQAEEIMRFERRAPIWSLVFIPDASSPAPASSSSGAGTKGQGTTIGAAPGTTQGGGASSGDVNRDLLVVGCWDRTYSLYKLSGNASKLMTEKGLKYYPCSINYSGNLTAKSSYLAISGSNRKVTLYSREGAKLSEVCLRDAWIWCCACHGESDLLALGTHGGTIELLKMNFDAVHALYKDRYAYRENLTEVIVHHLVTDKKVRIKCKDLIRNLSLYKNKLAVQLSDRVCIYESSPDDSVDMHFRLRKEKIVISDRREEAVDPARKGNKAKGGLNNKSNLMAIASTFLLFCTGNVLELYSFDGQRQKVWVLASNALCMRVDGGPDGREGVLLGLDSGAVVKVFVDNPFPLEMTKRAASAAQVDINIYRTMLASVDSENVLHVTDLRTQEVLFTAPNIVSACFNTEVEDLLCITGTDGSISVLSGVRNAASSQVEDAGATQHGLPHSIRSSSGLPELQEQHIFGMALGFRGQKIFCLYRGSIIGVDVPQSSNMQRALDAGDVTSAYRIACLGATEADWKLLAMRALRGNHLSVAKNAFARLKDVKFLSLIDAIERRGGGATIAASKSSSGAFGADGKSATGAAAGGGRNRAGAASGPTNGSVAGSGSGAANAVVVPPLDPAWQAELLAYEGHHQEAAKIYARSGKLDEAIRLFTDLRRWEDAKMFARNAGMADVSDLTAQQAKWLQEINDWKGASELFVSMGQFMAAAKIIGDNEEEGWEDALLEVVRACPLDDLDTLSYCGERFSTLTDTAFAKETYTKSKDVSKLMALYAKRQMWNNAAKLADENEGKFDVSIFLPYAEWLVSQDRYEEAMSAFKKSQRIDLAKKVLEELTANAVAECRFKDAAYYFWMLSKETEAELQLMAATESKSVLQQHAQQQFEYELKADLYFAYASVHAFVTDPFTSQQPEMLFQVARFIVNSLGTSETIPLGISKASTLYTLARQAMQLGAYKLARHAYDRLSKLQMGERKQEEVEVEMLLVQAKPVRDDPDHLPVCYRCGSTNPLLNPFTNKFAMGDVCTNCGHPFVRSFINFDILPLVEFVPDPSISDEEAIELIRQPPPANNGKGNFGAGAKNAKSGAAGAGGKASNRAGGGWKESKADGGSGADMLTLDDNDEGDSRPSAGGRGGGRGGGAGAGADAKKYHMDQGDGDDDDAVHIAMGVNAGESDLFTRCLNLTLEKQKAAYTPVKVDAGTLLSIPRAEVFVCRPSGKAPGKRATFYRNMLPDIPVAISQPCHRFFHQEDFEFAYLSGKKCPYSRLKSVGEYGSL
eukprot:CAMPEP_0184976768 /NCGR_PEP_ID=MMETSP1098-20130426/7662_1 /TAXON_ID=89044 /ORGANISM="Spumella elongata, Strain CCAP 955/1" /LENGTH=1432 /DNA_ID=CAMNT_0027499697 /DNA_START=50 /DNA_END=4348 /DNA_ORIENTATION=+